MELVDDLDWVDANQACFGAASASNAAFLVQRIWQIFVLVKETVPEPFGAIGAEIVASGDASELADLAGVPCPVAHPGVEQQINLIVHIETKTGGAYDIAGAATKAAIG